MAYTKINWENSPSTKTPINATNLNHMDNGIYQNTEDITKAKSDLKSCQDEVTKLNEDTVKTISVNGIPQTMINNNVNIMVDNKTVYGIKRRLTSNSASSWERINNSVGLVANATKDGTEVQNDFDNIYPWSKIISYNYNTSTKKVVAEYGDINFKFDGSNGEVLTRIPEFYWKRYQDAEYEYILISQYAIDGFNKSEEFSVGRYTIYYDNSKAHSYSGYCPEVNRNITSFRTLAKGVGDNFGLLDYHYFLIQMLYLVEYADYNSQSKLGNGVSSCRTSDADKALVAENNVNRIIIATSGANNFLVGQQVSIGQTSLWNWNVARNRTITSIEDYTSGDIEGKAVYFDGAAVNIAVGNVLWSTGQKSGQCDSLGMKSGCLNNDGKHSNIYRGIENPFGNIWQFIDGINIKDYVAYVCTSPEHYKVDTFTEPYYPVGYTNCQTTNSYVKTLGYDENNPLFAFPVEVNGGSSTYVCDYYWCNTGNRIALAGGSWNLGANDGLFYWCLSGGSGSAYLSRGSRLLMHQ